MVSGLILAGLFRSGQVVQRIHQRVVDIHAKVAVAAGANARGAHVGDELPLIHMLTGADHQRAAMAVDGLNVYDILNHSALILTADAVQKAGEALA